MTTLAYIFGMLTIALLIYNYYIDIQEEHRAEVRRRNKQKEIEAERLVYIEQMYIKNAVNFYEASKIEIGGKHEHYFEKL